MIDYLRALPQRPYLATPYTRYFRGHHGAYIDACRLTTKIYRKHKLRVFSPIVYAHGLAFHGDYPPIDHEFWRSENADWVEHAPACIVAKMIGWDESRGIREEISDFRAAKKMVVFVHPESLEISEA
jgi:hypothetical protein